MSPHGPIGSLNGPICDSQLQVQCSFCSVVHPVMLHRDALSLRHVKALFQYFLRGQGRVGLSLSGETAENNQLLHIM